jgi:hypothetical protein
MCTRWKTGPDKLFCSLVIRVEANSTHLFAFGVVKADHKPCMARWSQGKVGYTRAYQRALADIKSSHEPVQHAARLRGIQIPSPPKAHDP